MGLFNWLKKKATHAKDWAKRHPIQAAVALGFSAVSGAAVGIWCGGAAVGVAVGMGVGVVFQSTFTYLGARLTIQEIANIKNRQQIADIDAKRIKYQDRVQKLNDQNVILEAGMEKNAEIIQKQQEELHAERNQKLVVNQPSANQSPTSTGNRTSATNGQRLFTRRPVNRNVPDVTRTATMKIG